MVKQKFLKDAIAKPNGFYSPAGECLVSKKLTSEFIAEWNGVEEKAVEPEVEVQAVEPEVKVQAEKPKKKKGLFKRK